MVETIRFRKIYLEDLRTGSGTEVVTLADGSIAALTKISLSSLGGAGSLDYLELAEQSASPSAPGSGTVRIFRKTDNKQYLLDDAGTELEWPFTVGTITSGVWQGTAVAGGYGGTGLATYTIGDLLYASAASTLAKLAAVATGQVLASQGAATAPAYTATPSITNLTLSGAAPATPAANVLYKDTIVKGWLETSGAGAWTIDADVNVSSITDNGTGDFTINWATAFSNADYVVVGIAIGTSARFFTETTTTAKTASLVRCNLYFTDAVLADPATGVNVIAIGAQ